MAEDPRLGAFLANWERDQRDGVTLRSVHNRLSGHIQRYDTDRQETRDRLKTLETKSEATEKQAAADALADAIAEGTGRHQVVPAAPVTPIQPFTPAFGTVVPIDLRAPAPPTETKHKTGFWPNAWKAARNHGGTAAGAAAITLLVTWLAGRGCLPAQAVEKAERPAASSR